VKCIDGDVTQANKYLKSALELIGHINLVGWRPIVYHNFYENLKLFSDKGLLD